MSDYLKDIKAKLGENKEGKYLLNRLEAAEIICEQVETLLLILAANPYSSRLGDKILEWKRAKSAWEDNKKWKCLHCGRNFLRKNVAHNCKGGYRKKHHEFMETE